MTLINITQLAQAIQLSAGAAAGWSPADATTYRYGNQPGQNPAVGDPLFSFIMTRAGTVSKVYGAWIVAGTLGSAQNMTVRIRNTVTTTTQDVTTTLGSGSVAQSFSNTAMTLSFSAADALCVEIVTPTWTTNPTVTFMNISVEVVYF